MAAKNVVAVKRKGFVDVLIFILSLRGAHYRRFTILNSRTTDW